MSANLKDYWSTGDDFNTFGRKANIASYFMARIEDYNAYFVSGSSNFKSSASTREAQGAYKAEAFHHNVKNGRIKLDKDETIKIVSHSQGGAHAHGFVNQLLTYVDVDGKPLYKVEVVYDINPHQATKMTPLPKNIRNVTYQHWNDGVSGTGWNMGGLNGGSEQGFTENGIDV
jgi:hypothetical protein